MSLQMSNLCRIFNMSPYCLKEASEYSVYLVRLSQVKIDPDYCFNIIFHLVPQADDFTQTDDSLSLETSNLPFLVLQLPLNLILDIYLIEEIGESIAACFVVVIES
jgi:hypothetical protein